ncbi:hypothetical protein OG735_40820 [Streptomyces sp. NBC_01210]|uniref:hypothetical protein n=1 Tax=Streptomyces sp. NBC_01210 TaxID=2903774 RepID=UPI002E10AB2D|nr:hypothetical protein OG735_40820 [Streptomyces sp. NBC_01210]
MRQSSGKIQGDPVWWVKCGDTLVGSLSSPESDQPWIVCHFEPSDGWESLSSLFEVQAEARRTGFPEDKVWAIKAVRELHLELHPVIDGEVLKPMLIYIEGAEARFRL